MRGLTLAGRPWPCACSQILGVALMALCARRPSLAIIHRAADARLLLGWVPDLGSSSGADPHVVSPGPLQVILWGLGSGGSTKPCFPGCHPGREARLSLTLVQLPQAWGRMTGHPRAPAKPIAPGDDAHVVQFQACMGRCGATHLQETEGKALSPARLPGSGMRAAVWPGGSGDGTPTSSFRRWAWTVGTQQLAALGCEHIRAAPGSQEQKEKPSACRLSEAVADGFPTRFGTAGTPLAPGSDQGDSLSSRDSGLPVSTLQGVRLALGDIPGATSKHWARPGWRQSPG